jgi:opacity protein-like surface antigen
MRMATLVLAMATAGAADSDTRTISGTVTDSSGRPVVGAVVKLKSPDHPAIRSFVTAADGGYRFTGLNAMLNYSVQARTEHGTSRTVHISRTSSRTERVINLDAAATTWPEPSPSTPPEPPTSFLGGNQSDTGHGIAVDLTGNAYIAGTTSRENRRGEPE